MSDRRRLVALSFLMLFTELALIRWAGSNVLYLSYFSNFVLLGSFLGIGIGFIRGDSKRDIFRGAPVALAAFILVVLFFPVSLERPEGTLLFFGIQTGGPPAWLMLPVIFGFSALVMAMIAQGVAATFVRFEPLEAYRLDIMGSILGIAGFSVMSFLHAPPVAWGVVAVVLFAVLIRPVEVAHVVAMAAIVIGLGAESLRPSESWSPYYRVSVSEREYEGERFYRIDANGIPHQVVESKELRRKLEPIYFEAYQRKVAPALDDVLIVGAGSGGDVAIALAQGAKRIDAVEIDPRIVQIGKELNPDRPYDDPRVSRHVTDGRAFIEQTDRTYDLVLFALPDSLTLVAGQSAIRLESYLFTREAMDAVQGLLKPNGVFGMYNYYREEWLIDRYANTLRAAFGHDPCVQFQGEDTNFALLTIGKNAEGVACETPWAPTATPPDPAVDDRPFPYLRTPGVPLYYAGVLGLILLVSLIAVRASSGGGLRSMRPYLDLFFMGVAFLLLEAKNVVQFALLFGTTWFVNALVFGGVLLSVLAAIEVAKRVSLRPKVLYLVLFLSLVVAWLVPQRSLLALGSVPRFLAATALAFTPIFIANLIFAERFRSVSASAVAFGANLLGAMVGGTLEYAALAVGYKSLLIVVALVYGLAFLATPRGVSAVAEPA